MTKQNKVILTIGVIIVAAAIFIFISKNSNLPNQTGQLKPIDQTDHVFGDPKAPVQMIVYSDFECPFCAQFVDSIKKVESYFGKKVAIAFRHYPLPGHAQARPAALASECAAEQGKFWEMHDKLFADNVAGKMGLEQYKIDAADLGLDAVKFGQCLDSAKFQDKIKEQISEGKNVGVTGTPTSFINGQFYPGAYPFEDFTAPDGRQEKGMKNIISELLE